MKVNDEKSNLWRIMFNALLLRIRGSLKGQTKGEIMLKCIQNKDFSFVQFLTIILLLSGK